MSKLHVDVGANGISKSQVLFVSAKEPGAHRLRNAEFSGITRK
jgi:hypothetical protein